MTLRTGGSVVPLFSLIPLVGLAAPAPSPAVAEPLLEQSLDIEKVWSGHPVGFCLLTTTGRQYAAFYDAERRMTVASRRLDETTWTFAHLPSRLGWDSHNYIVMDVDATGCLHLSGNMHASPLVYFRTGKPHDITTFRQVPTMIGREEKRVTYPKFFRSPADELVFTYRDGGSGNGNQIYNRYDADTQTWSRLLDTPLIDGKGEMNAYLDTLRRDKKGMFHLCWVWRDTPDCATNHDVCYARSRDLMRWEKSDGEPLVLPITYATNEIVERIRPGQGLINGNARLGFDAEDRPVISYIKYDGNGHTQTYNARLEDGAWRSRQVSDWDYRWEFSGGGSIPFEVSIGPVEATVDGKLVQAFRHPKSGSGRWLLDPATLIREKTLPSARRVPASAGKPQSAFPGMHVRYAEDLGGSSEPGIQYVLRWETLGPNRDQPREGLLPPPSTLHVLRLRSR
jgi:hypothetical protein